MTTGNQLPIFITLGFLLLSILASDSYASSAGIEIIVIKTIIYIGALPAFVIGAIYASRQNGTYKISITTALIALIVILIGFSLVAWINNPKPGFLHHLEWPAILFPFIAILTVITNTITYWGILGLRYMVNKEK
jgi:DMSO reductase anchor subunit